MSMTIQTLTQSHFVTIDASLDRSRIQALLPLGSARPVTQYHQSTPVKKRVLLMVLALHIIVLTYLLIPAAPALPQVEEVPITVSLIHEIPSAPIIEPTQSPTPKPPEIKKTIPVKPEKVIPLPIKETPSPIKASEMLSQTTEKPTVPVTETSPPVSSKPSAENAKAEEANISEAPAPKEEVVEPPKFGVAYLNNPKPEYSRSSRRAGEQGKVLLRVLVNELGLPESVEIAKGSGFERLDESALDAVKKWRFVPAKRNNAPMSAYVTVPIQFSLD